MKDKPECDWCKKEGIHKVRMKEKDKDSTTIIFLCEKHFNDLESD